MVTTGNEVVSAFASEATFGTKPALLNKVFGLNESVSGLTTTENQKKVMELGQATVKAFSYGKKMRTYSLSWTFSGADFLPLLFGTVSGTSTLTHTYRKPITSFSHLVSFDNPRYDRTFLGCLLNSFSLRYAIDQVIECSAEVICGKEADPTTTGAQPAKVADSVNFPYNAEHAVIQIGGVTVAEVQSVDININPNHELVYGSGVEESEAVNGHKQAMDYGGKINATFKNGVSVGYVKARTEQASLVVTISNGVTGAGNKSTRFTFMGIGFPEHSNPSIEPTQLVLEDVTWDARECTVLHTS